MTTIEQTGLELPAELADLTDAEKLALIRQMTEIAAIGGIPLGDTQSPGQLAQRHRPGKIAQPPHLDLIDQALTDVYATDDARLMIFTPPRAGKSSRVSQWFPFWYLTLRPSTRIMITSYAASLATKNGSAVRDLVRLYGARYGLRINPGQDTRAEWSTTSGGGVLSRGIRGSMTGNDVDLGIIDDPIKDRLAAESKTIRDATIDNYSSAWATRRSPGSREVLVCTRWHEDDLAGFLLKDQGRVEEGGLWTVLHLPALALAEDHEQGVYADPMGRDVGDPLTHPKVDPDEPKTWGAAGSHHNALLAYWMRQKGSVTARDWNAMYQGTPFDQEGSLLSRDDIVDATRPLKGTVVRSAVGVDPSGGGRDNAGIVGASLTAAGKVWFVEDRTAHMKADEWAGAACLLAYKLTADTIVIEKNYGGDQATTLVRQSWAALQRELDPITLEPKIPPTALCPNVVGVNSRQSKILRAEPIAGAVKTDRVYFAPRLVRQVSNDFQKWTPGSKWSPGALDAAVHVAWHLLPRIDRHDTKLTSPAGKTRSGTTARPGSIASQSRAGTRRTG